MPDDSLPAVDNLRLNVKLSSKRAPALFSDLSTVDSNERVARLIHLAAIGLIFEDSKSGGATRRATSNQQGEHPPRVATKSATPVAPESSTVSLPVDINEDESGELISAFGLEQS